MERTDTKDLLFHTALTLFRQKGCENVSIQEICQASGTTRNAFYYHYNSKEDLLCSYFKCLPISENEMFHNLLKQPSDWEKLLYVYEIHTHMLVLEGKDFVRQLSIACIKNRTSLFAHLNPASYCEPLIQRCKDAGLITSPLSAADLAYFARTISNAAVRAWSLSDKEYDVIAETRQQLTKFFRPELSLQTAAERIFE